MKTPLILAACLAATLAAASAQSTPIPAASSDPASADRALAAYTVEDSVSEIQLCQLALTHASNPAVKQFATAMIADHTQMISSAQQLGRVVGADAGDLTLKPSQEGVIEQAHLAMYRGYQFDEDS